LGYSRLATDAAARVPKALGEVFEQHQFGDQTCTRRFCLTTPLPKINDVLDGCRRSQQGSWQAVCVKTRGRLQPPRCRAAVFVPRLGATQRFIGCTQIRSLLLDLSQMCLCRGQFCTSRCQLNVVAQPVGFELLKRLQTPAASFDREFRGSNLATAFCLFGRQA
jgi:hypothetical protein